MGFLFCKVFPNWKVGSLSNDIIGSVYFFSGGGDVGQNQVAPLSENTNLVAKI